MEHERRHYSQEFKEEALRLLERSGKSIAQLARELEIPAGRLWDWRREKRLRSRGAVGEAGLAREGSERMEEEVVRLRREVEQLRLEREFLKKAAAYFAKESK
jgi:transposase